MAKYHIFYIKQVSVPSFQKDLVPKMEYIYFQCYETWYPEQVKFVNHKYNI